MADISAIFFILLILGVAFPALLAAWRLLFPNLVVRAQTRVEQTPGRTFVMGLVIMVVLVVPVFVLLALPFGPAKLLGWLLLILFLSISTLGSAGIAAHLGAQLKREAGGSPFGGFVRGAVILELAAFLPLIGWLFVWIPALVIAFGATGFALLKWTPHEKPQVASVTTRVTHA